MKILGIDSSAKAASVALCDEDGLIAQYFQNCGLTHSKTLLPMAEDMLKNLELSARDVDVIAVNQGPGSFTGIRIGVSTVKGLAWALDKPVIGVSTLEAMAFNAVSQPEGTIVCCAMDARRSQFYNALFEMKNGLPLRLCEDRAIGGDELVEYVKKYEKPLYIVGDGAKLCYNTLDNSGIPCTLAPEPMRVQSAWGVCMAALGKPTVSVHELLPVYLRLSQAERERQARVFDK